MATRTPPENAMRGTPEEVAPMLAGYDEHGIAELIAHVWPRRPEAVAELAKAAELARGRCRSVAGAAAASAAVAAARGEHSRQEQRGQRRDSVERRAGADRRIVRVVMGTSRVRAADPAPPGGQPAAGPGGRSLAATCQPPIRPRGLRAARTRRSCWVAGVAEMKCPVSRSASIRMCRARTTRLGRRRRPRRSTGATGPGP